MPRPLPPFAIVVGAVCALGVGLALYLFLAVPEQQRDLRNLTGNAERGAYVVRLAGCVACHTLPEGKGDLLAGGAPLKTPFGTFIAPNITPHPDQGIGTWSQDAFVAALVNGRAPNGAHLYPVFPYPSYARMTDQDIADLWAYLQTVPESPTASRPHALSFPFTLRFLMAPWKTLFFDPAPFVPDPARSARWNRGAYLVNGPGHCGVCHTPRGWFGQSDDSRALEGTVGLDGEKVPAITAAALREKGWTVDELAFGLQFGFEPSGDVLGGSMGEVIQNSTSHWSLEDRMAVAEYLLSESP